jgi:hypothetical protein
VYVVGEVCSGLFVFAEIEELSMGKSIILVTDDSILL